MRSRAKHRVDRSWAPFPLALGLVLGFLVFGLVLANRTRAEFEVPIVGTGSAVPSRLHNLFAYARSDYDPNSGSTHEYYEAFAVGAELDSGGSEIGGVIYRYDGTQWLRVKPTIPTAQRINAVTGQYDFAGGYAPIWMAGNNGTIFFNPNEQTNLVTHQGQYAAAPMQNCSGVNTVFTQNLHAISAAAGFRFPKLAGGQDGMLFAYTGDIGNQPWQQLCLTGLPAGEHIAGIAYGPNAVAYLVTTSGGADLARPCPAGSTGKLYRFNGSTVELLATRAGACFYGLDVTRTTNNPLPLDQGHLRNAIWVAGSDGVYRFDEGTDTAGVTWGDGNRRAGTENKAWYSLSAFERRGGSGQNLLPNGDFDSWNSPNPSGAQVNPSSWVASDEGQGRNNGAGFEDGGCDASLPIGLDANINDIRFANNEGFSGSDAIRLEPGKSYTSLANCNTSSSPILDHTVGVIGRIDLSNIDGRRFRVSGQYKVEFPSVTPAGPRPEGGVSFRCDGSSISNSSDCSFTNRRAIRTNSQGPTANEPGHVNGYIPFDFIISSQATQYNTPIPGNTAVPRLSRRNMVLEIVCEATYGARVWCDDLRVEAVDTPAIGAYSDIEIISVGEAGAVVANPDALGSGVFSSVPNQAGGIIGQHLYALDTAEGQFSFAAGENSIFLVESPANISGFIWAGTASPVSSSSESGLGWISSSCSNTRDAAGNSLCQRWPNGYGLRLDIPNKTLRGRAWLGKSVLASNSESETINLGQCLRNEHLGPPYPGVGANEAYNLTGMCNPTSHRCYSSRAKIADSNYSCLRDFDCFGRCESDEGFLCVADGDCQRGLPTASPNLAESPFSATGAATQFRIQCDANLNSPGACTGGGWLTFNPTDFVGTPLPAVAGCANGGQLNADGRRLQGCGQFMTLANQNDPNNPAPGATTRGWVSLRGVNDPATPITVSSTCDPVNLRCYADWSKACIVASQATDCANIPQVFGCRKCDPGPAGGDPNDLNCGFCQDASGRSCRPTANSCHYFCDGDVTKPSCDNDLDCVVAVGATSVCQPAGRCTVGGAVCTNNSQCLSLNGICSFGALCQVGSGPTACQQYGVDYDSSTGSLTGFAWSPDYGWLNFRNLQHGTTRFIRTQLGDVHSQGSIGSFETRLPPNNVCNSTYFITAAGGINNFCSKFLTQVASFESLRTGVQLPLTTSGNVFENAVGRFDIAGLETDSGGGRNKYGMLIQEFTDPDDILPILGPIDFPLDSNVILINDPIAMGRYTLNTDTKIVDGALASGSPQNRIVAGNGLMIVNGHLRIESNVTYIKNSTNVPVTDVRHIASLVVVVKGDLVIDASVTDLAGFYFVTGTICTASVNNETDCSSLMINPALNRSPLTVRGLVFAKEFNLGRKFAGTVDDPLPSELFINDGRAQTNPLPGMTDFVSLLPSTVPANP